MPRRNQGGQPGNTNARKHGFYADALGARARNILHRASEIPAHEIEREIALLRARIHQLVATEPDNITVLTLALRTLVRMVALNHGLNEEQETGIHQSLRDLIQDLSPKGAV
jgi:hypothetical protein